MTDTPFFDSMVGKTRIRFGLGRAKELPQALAELNCHHPFIIGSVGGIARTKGLLNSFENAPLAMFEETPIHCPEPVALETHSAFRKSGADCIILTGGGSLIGVGKYITQATKAPLIILPTTYSGSEMTAIYGIKRAHEKRTWVDEGARAKSIIYDPELTFSLPAMETATTGINSMAHLVEALYPATPDPEAEKYAIDGLKAHCDGLPAAIKNPEDPVARSRTLYGGFLGGRVVSMVGIALHHKLCHVLGGHYGAPHGATNSVILPHVVALNAPSIPEAIKILNDVFMTDNAAGSLYDFAKSIGAPTSLKSLGLPRDGLTGVADETLATLKYNPHSVSRAGLISLLETAWNGLRPSCAGLA